MKENGEQAEQARKPIYMVGGSKGGVGKSMMSIALIDHLVSKGEQVVFVDTDTSNPDVWKCYKDELKGALVNMDEGDGWVELVNLCEAQREAAVVVNTAARNDAGTTRFGKTLEGALEELGRKLVTLWVINRQRDSLEALKVFMEAMPTSEIHVVRNGHAGEPRKFELYNSSNLRKEIESKGGTSVTLPDLADRVADDVYTKRLSVTTAMRVLPIGNRSELARWRGEVQKMMAEIIE